MPYRGFRPWVQRGHCEVGEVLLLWSFWPHSTDLSEGKKRHAPYRWSVVGGRYPLGGSIKGIRSVKVLGQRPVSDEQQPCRRSSSSVKDLGQRPVSDEQTQLFSHGHLR